MAQIFELEPSRDAEDHLWEHGLYIEDAYDVLDEDRYKVFPDPRHDDRVKIVGPDRGGRLLTFVVTRPDGQGEMPYCHRVAGRRRRADDLFETGRDAAWLILSAAKR